MKKFFFSLKKFKRDYLIKIKLKKNKLIIRINEN